MPVAEIAAAVTGLRSALDITKAMVSLRDAEAFRAKSIELQEIILRALDSGIEAGEAYGRQLDAIRALEAEVNRLKAWEEERKRYELKAIGHGAVAYIFKPQERGTETPYWLCANCFAKGQIAFLQSTNRVERGHLLVACNDCNTTVPISKDARGWAD